MAAKLYWVYVYLKAGTRLYPSRSFGPTSFTAAHRMAESIGTNGFWDENLFDFIPPGRVDGVSIRLKAPPVNNYGDY